MENVAIELEKLVDSFYSNYINLEENITSTNLSNDKWSLKEIIGHLIDSASNNHQRFIRLQLNNNLNFSDYNKDQWLSIEKHNGMLFSELFSIFYFYNKLIKHIILNVNLNCLQNKWIIDWDENTKSITLEKLILHYVEHLKGHIIHFKERLEELKNST